MPKKKKEGKPANLTPTQVAFRAMLMDTPSVKRSRMAAQTIANRRSSTARGRFPSEAAMRRWLARAGWKLAPEHWAPKGGLPLEQVFRMLLAEKGLAKRLGVGVNRVSDVRTRLFLTNQLPTLQVMRDWLRKAGWHRASEESWVAT